MAHLGTGWRFLIRGLGAGAAILIGVVAVLVAADVVFRNVGGPALPWIVEVTEYALPAATFLAAPWILHENQHVRLEILLGLLPGRVSRLLGLVADGLCLVTCLVLVYYGSASALAAWRIGGLVIKTLVFPEWWLLSLLPAGSLLLAVEFARRLGATLRGSGDVA